MTREQTIAKMVKMANAITGKNTDRWTRKAENKIWTLCSDWNREHYEGCRDDYFLYEI